MKFPTVKGQIEQIMEGIMNAPEIKAVSDEAAFSLRLAIEELTANVMNYAYAESEDGSLCVEIMREEDKLCITLSDHGTPFNPLEHEDPDVTLSAEDREIGGLGIFLVKQLMDSVEYEYIDGENRTTIQKIIN